jgi:DNA modification methylase
VVLDPFCGSGTTLAVAQSLGRSYLGIDCVAEYCQMARDRLKECDAPLFEASAKNKAVRENELIRLPNKGRARNDDED